MNDTTRRSLARFAALWMLFSAVTPARAGVPADDLKQIEYRYYFRGKYAQAIEALQTFLARVEVTGETAVRAGEFLAASHVLSGAPASGKDVFARLMVADPGYAGPDPTIFKPEVVDVYAVARSEYASLALRSAAPAPADSVASTVPPSPTTQSVAGTPIYKKWWFYAGAVAVAGVVAGLAASGGEEAAPAPSGTLVVGVRVQ
jgi:hypothetical protein